MPKLTCLQHCIERIFIKTVPFQDTAGQERFHALGPIYYRDSNGAILVYDITDEDSFQKVSTEYTLCYGQGRSRGLISLSCFVMWNDQLGKGECCYKIYQLLAAVICTCSHPLMIRRSGTLHLMSGICNKTGCVMYSVCTGNSHDDYGS